MFSIHASGSEELIRAAWEVLAWSDPTPASAVDAKKTAAQSGSLMPMQIRKASQTPVKP